MVGYIPHVVSGWSVAAKRRTAYLAIGAKAVEIAALAIGATDQMETRMVTVVAVITLAQLEGIPSVMTILPAEIAESANLASPRMGTLEIVAPMTTTFAIV